LLEKPSRHLRSAALVCIHLCLQNSVSAKVCDDTCVSMIRLDGCNIPLLKYSMII
jgi:hypothetical protein